MNQNHFIAIRMKENFNLLPAHNHRKIMEEGHPFDPYLLKIYSWFDLKLYIGILYNNDIDLISVIPIGCVSKKCTEVRMSEFKLRLCKVFDAFMQVTKNNTVLNRENKNRVTVMPESKNVIIQIIATLLFS